MPNRYLDTGYFKSPFVRGLKGSLKGLYSFIICDARGSGIWPKDLEVASLYVGFQISETEWNDFFVKTGKAIDLKDGNFFFPDFIEHQYPKGLSATNPAHNNFILELQKYSLLDENLNVIKRPFEDPSKGLERVTCNGNSNSKGNGKGKSSGNKAEKLEIVFPFESDDFLKMWQHWKNYKSKEFKFKFISEESEQSALNGLAKLAKTENIAIEIISQSMENGWKGFFELKENSNGRSKNNGISEERRNLVTAILDRDRGADPQ